MISPGAHVVVNVSAPREWESKYGPMKTYTLKFDGDDAAYQLNKKAASPPPSIGESLTVESVTPDPDGKWPAKIKLAQAAGGRGGAPMDPAREAKIVRQHSQGVAVQWANLAHQRGLLPDDFKLADLTKIIDWFDADAKAARP